MVKAFAEAIPAVHYSALKESYLDLSHGAHVFPAYPMSIFAHSPMAISSVGHLPSEFNEIDNSYDLGSMYYDCNLFLIKILQQHSHRYYFELKSVWNKFSYWPNLPSSNIGTLDDLWHFNHFH